MCVVVAKGKGRWERRTAHVVVVVKAKDFARGFSASSLCRGRPCPHPLGRCPCATSSPAASSLPLDMGAGYWARPADSCALRPAAVLAAGRHVPGQGRRVRLLHRVEEVRLCATHEGSVGAESGERSRAKQAEQTEEAQKTKRCKLAGGGAGEAVADEGAGAATRTQGARGGRRLQMEAQRGALGGGLTRSGSVASIQAATRPRRSISASASLPTTTLVVNNTCCEQHLLC